MRETNIMIARSTRSKYARAKIHEKTRAETHANCCFIELLCEEILQRYEAVILFSSQFCDATKCLNAVSHHKIILIFLREFFALQHTRLCRLFLLHVIDR